MLTHQQLLVVFTACLVFLATACSFGQEPPVSVQDAPASQTTLSPTASPPSAGEIQSEPEAQVNSIEVRLLESFPVQVNVVARGTLPDGCTTIDQITQSRVENNFQVTITTARPADAMCTEALVPFEEIIPLDAVGLAAGPYTVNVNGVTDRFELSGDNVLPETPNLDNNEPAPLQWQEIQVPEAGIAFEVPGGWHKTDLQWTPPINPNLHIGLKWAKNEANWTPASMLPNNGKVVNRQSVDLGWAQGVRYQIELLNSTGKTILVEEHVIAPLDQTLAYDFYASGPTFDELEKLQDVYQHLLNTVVLEASVVNPLPASCSPQPGKTRYVHEADGYCLLYPAHFPSLVAEPGLFTISGLPTGEGSEPVAATLTIRTEALTTNGSLEQIVDDKLNAFSGVPLTRTSTTLGGEPAEMVEGLPGQTETRQLFAIHNNTLYHFTASPLDETLSEVTPEVKTMWDTVTASFAFLR